MAGPYFDTSGQIALRVEATEGQQETLDGTDVKFRVYDLGKDFDVQMNERDPKDSDREQGSISGARMVTLRAQTHLHGYGDADTLPGFSDALRTCGMVLITERPKMVDTTPGTSDVIPIGTVLDDGAGNFARLLFQDTGKTRACLLPFAGSTLSVGSWQDEGDTITLEVSAVGVGDAGYTWRTMAPNELASAPSATVRRTDTEKVTQIVGARGRATFTLGHRQIGMVEFEWQGKYTPSADASEFTPSPAIPDITPRVTIDKCEWTPEGGTVFSPIGSEAVITVDSDLQMRDSLCEPTGYLSTSIVNQPVTTTLDPEEREEAVIDWSAALVDNTKFEVGYWWGLETATPADGAGVCGFFMEEVTLNEAAEGDRNSILIRTITGEANGEYDGLCLFFVIYPDTA